MNARMAERNGKESVPSPPAEQGSLSGRMRDLILGQSVEERREPRNGGDDEGLVKERRRRDDDTTKSADGKS